jgi:hypothetical protein
MSWLTAIANIGGAMGRILTQPSVTNAVASVGSTLFANNLQRQNNLSIYNTQRQDALADYNKQNLYNSPKETMARFKEAGLNPHLIYGQTNQAAPIRSVDFKPSTVDTPNINVLTNAQLQLIKAQTESVNANTAKTLIDAGIGNVKKYVQEQTKDIQVGKLFADTTTQMDRGDNIRANTDFLQKSQDAKIKNILANTSLTYANRAKAYQTISSLITTQNLTRKKIVSEDFVQQVLAGRSDLQTSQKSYTESQKQIASKVLELKQLGLTSSLISQILNLK